MHSRSACQCLALGLALTFALSARGESPRPQNVKNSPPPVVEVQHRAAGSWAMAVTTNFRIYHRGQREVAEQVARVAERTRTAQLRKWVGEASPDWEPVCCIFLHRDGIAYSEATGAPPQSPGHATIRVDDDRVTSRRIDLHGDPEEVLRAVLPHEVTHVVIAGQFSGHPVPRWADEGMAVLTEPRERVERHLRTLPHWREQDMLFELRDLVRMRDYPHPRAVGTFYAQSVSLVEFLTQEKGTRTFTRFVRDGLRGGYEEALKRHYGWDFAELEVRWRRHAFADVAAVEGAQ
jgi:hypothetical protein